MAQELAGQWVGPMPVKNFIETFVELPEVVNDAESMPEFEDNFLSRLPREIEDNSFFDHFITAVTASNALGEFKLTKRTFNSAQNSLVGVKKKPAISVCEEDTELLGTQLTGFEGIELLFEFDAFKDPADPFDDDAEIKKEFCVSRSTAEDTHDSRETCRGWLASRAGAWFAGQHRTHCFILWLGDPDARIIRFDLSGAIFSAKFNYRNQGQLLLEFLWRFSQAADDVRGHDTTVSEASPEESSAAKAGLEEWKPATDRQVMKMEMPDAKKGTRFIFVWKPVAEPFSVTGRATRGYPGWDPLGNDGKGAVVFVKDSWRSCEDGMEKESAVIEDLNAKRCRNVPILICGDDIPGQSTVTKNFVNEPWNLGGRADDIVARAHTRFAQNFVGYHLETFKTSRQLIQAIYDALIAHKDAYERCQILHRDISAGNILLTKEGGGILNDWDLAKRTNTDPIARQPYRSGTWQFMSAKLLLDPRKINTIHDDMESTYWLLLYHILRYMSHNRLDDVQAIMRYIFDQEHQLKPSEPFCGGRGKESVILSNALLGLHFDVEGNKPLGYLISILRQYWMEWYYASTVHENIVATAMRFQDISREDAEKLHPFDSRNLKMVDYDAMIQAFETALAMKTWPPDDAAVDRLPHKKGRGLDAIDEDDFQDTTEPNVAEAATTAPRETKRLKTSHNPNDEYRPPAKNSLILRSRVSDREKPRVDYSGQDSTAEKESWSVSESESDPDLLKFSVLPMSKGKRNAIK